VTARTLGDKLQEIGRRSPKDLHALEVLSDLVLERLGPENAAAPRFYQQADTKPYHWKCDDPKKGGA
jgi:hypothetical protein